MYGFWRWCLLDRHINDGHDISPVLAKEFRVMLKRAGVKRRVWELHRDATSIVLEVVAANKGVWHADPGDDILYLPIGGEIWEQPERNGCSDMTDPLQSVLRVQATELPILSNLAAMPPFCCPNGR